jgi:predicted DNA-binding transcriptional regulator AlpA
MALTQLHNTFPLRTALRVREFCDAFGIGTTLFYSLVKKGQLRVRKIGKVTVVPLTEIAAWMERTATTDGEHEAC